MISLNFSNVAIHYINSIGGFANEIGISKEDYNKFIDEQIIIMNKNRRISKQIDEEKKYFYPFDEVYDSDYYITLMVKTLKHKYSNAKCFFIKKTSSKMFTIVFFMEDIFDEIQNIFENFGLNKEFRSIDDIC